MANRVVIDTGKNEMATLFGAAEEAAAPISFPGKRGAADPTCEETFNGNQEDTNRDHPLGKHPGSCSGCVLKLPPRVAAPKLLSALRQVMKKLGLFSEFDTMISKMIKRVQSLK